MLDKTEKHDTKYFVIRITSAWSKQVESILKVGRLLIEAKDELEHGEWGQMFDKGGLPFVQRTAQKLMAIAEHPILSNPTHASHLPPHFETLYEMRKLPDQELEQMLAEGTIDCETERKEVEKLIQWVNKGGLYATGRVPEALNMLIPFMRKWPNVEDLPDNVYSDIDESDHSLSTTEFGEVTSWIANLYAAYMKHLQKMDASHLEDEALERAQALTEENESKPKPKSKSKSRRKYGSGSVH